MFKGVRKEYKIIGICYSNITSEDVSNIVTSVCNAAVAEGYKVMLIASFADGIDEFIRTADARMYEDKRQRKSVRGQNPEE